MNILKCSICQADYDIDEYPDGQRYQIRSCDCDLEEKIRQLEICEISFNGNDYKMSRRLFEFVDALTDNRCELMAHINNLHEYIVGLDLDKYGELMDDIEAYDSMIAEVTK